MNRRQRKKQKSDPLQSLKTLWANIDFSQINATIKTQGLKLKEKSHTFWLGLPQLHRRLLSVIAPIVIVLLLWPTGEGDVSQPSPANQRVTVSVNTQSLSEQSGAVQPEETVETQWHEYTVKKGDTLAQVFRKNQLPMADLNSLARVEGNDKPLSRIKQGQLIRFKYSQEGQLDILQIEKGEQSVMFFRLSDGGFGRSK
ncbi:OapA family protein [Vibrio methylphosphonaticus]|uniref:OapA family protein n=1 Tax=Vibrio methylphosphonaticus TaxID=2946866 RepID=UPI00202A0D65|nr:LysM-like peptidoglycan-binding domain-containing protein [Vibrio methylphosphonaticus]MCL9777099.1 lysine transporter LysM [Vibrio methylphosphonaticus]